MKVKEFIDLVNDSSFFHADLQNDKVRFRYWRMMLDVFIKKPDMEVIVNAKALKGIQIKTSEKGLSEFDVEQLCELLTLIKWFEENEANKRIKKASDK